jgi:16S rRNA (adenine1518-N6/adenine1519-N6)-dimethyltransferase
MIRAKKSLGQNFLMHARIAERIAKTARLTQQSVAFEIGPGTGMLTRELLKFAGRVVALEADYELFETLQTKFATEIREGQLELLHGDIRSFDPTTLPTGYTLVANIPYYLTGEIIRMFLETTHQPRSMTLLVQKEVADRIARSTKGSILSLSVKAYGVPKYAFTVPKGAFVPAPKVDSAVITIEDISRRHFVNTKEEQTFFALLHAGFAHKRKFVRSNLIDAGLSPGTIPEKARAEDLSLSNWLALVKAQSC